MTGAAHICISVSVGCLLDLLIGDPYALPHPVRAIGRWIAFLEGHLRREGDTPAAQRQKGALLVLLTAAPTAGCTAGVLYLAFRLHSAAGIALESVLCAYALAARNLRDESMRVYDALTGTITGDLKSGAAKRGADCECTAAGGNAADDGCGAVGASADVSRQALTRARAAVARIVGRDTERLDAAGIVRAAVETVAENTSDGVIAPLFYLLLGGPVLGMTYKAVNTMDSMLGYRNDTYRYFGTAAARLDDAANFLPARLSALAMLAATVPLRMDTRNAWRIFRRDRGRHESPNAGQTESVCAGALRVRLGGNACYFGKPAEKPWIGDDLRPVEAEDIRRANRLMFVSAALAWLLLSLCLSALCLLPR